MILISFNASAAIGDDLGEESTIEKNLNVDVPIKNILEPMALLNAPILSDEIQNNFIEISNLQEFSHYSFLTNDLPPPAK
jgi:hypothetical protein